MLACPFCFKSFSVFQACAVGVAASPTARVAGQPGWIFALRFEASTFGIPIAVLIEKSHPAASRQDLRKYQVQLILIPKGGSRGTHFGYWCLVVLHKAAQSVVQITSVFLDRPPLCWLATGEAALSFFVII